MPESDDQTNKSSLTPEQQKRLVLATIKSELEKEINTLTEPPSPLGKNWQEYDQLKKLRKSLDEEMKRPPEKKLNTARSPKAYFSAQALAEGAHKSNLEKEMERIRTKSPKSSFYIKYFKKGTPTGVEQFDQYKKLMGKLAETYLAIEGPPSQLNDIENIRQANPVQAQKIIQETESKFRELTKGNSQMHKRIQNAEFTRIISELSNKIIGQNDKSPADKCAELRKTAAFQQISDTLKSFTTVSKKNSPNPLAQNRGKARTKGPTGANTLGR